MEYNTYIFFPAIFLLSFVQFKRNKGLIKECPINEKNSPNHCVKLKYWERKWFKVDVLYIPKNIYISYYLLWAIVMLDLLTPLFGMFFTIGGFYDYFVTFRRFEVHIMLAVFIVENALTLFVSYIYRKRKG